MSKVWGYIGTTKIVEINPEKKIEAMTRGLKIAFNLIEKKKYEERLRGNQNE